MNINFSIPISVEILKNVGPSGIDMAIERFGDPSAPPVFLIMGAGAQMITWPDGLKHLHYSSLI